MNTDRIEKATNSRDITLTALSGGKPRRTPHIELNINAVSIKKIVSVLKNDPLIKIKNEEYGSESEQTLDEYCFILDELGVDASTSNVSLGMNALDGEHYKTKMGIVFKRSNHGEAVVIDGPVQSCDDLKNIDIASSFDTDDLKNSIYLIEHLKKGKAHVLNIFDPFKLSWLLRGGMQNYLVDMAANAELVLALAEETTNYIIKIIDNAAEIGIDIVALIGDLAGKEATIISPGHFSQYIAPFYRHIVDHAHDKGLAVIKHSDGNCRELLPDLIDLGFDAFHPVQPQCMDIGDVRKEVNRNICLIGNVDCEELLVTGSEEEVETEVINLLELVGKEGAYILSSSNSIHPGVKPENYIAMVRTLHRYYR